MDRHGKNATGGFSLIEVLAAVAILMMIVGMMAMLFGESNRSWALGTRRAENNNSGRAALQLLTHDLQYAVADHVLTFALLLEDGKKAMTYPGTGGAEFQCNDLRFVSLQHDSRVKKLKDGTQRQDRTAREIYYYVSDSPYRNTDFPHRYALMRGHVGWALTDNPAVHCYHDRKWYDGPRLGSAVVVAENVAGFAVYVPDPAKGNEGELVREYYSDEPLVSPDPDNRFGSITQHLDRLPPFADVYLEIMNEAAAKQLSELIERGVQPAEQGQPISYSTFIEKNTRRYTTRVYFHNGHGYQDALRLIRERKKE